MRNGGIVMSHNIPFGYFLLSFNDNMGDIIDSLSEFWIFFY